VGKFLDISKKGYTEKPILTQIIRYSCGKILYNFRNEMIFSKICDFMIKIFIILPVHKSLSGIYRNFLYNNSEPRLSVDING